MQQLSPAVHAALAARAARLARRRHVRFVRRLLVSPAVHAMRAGISSACQWSASVAATTALGKRERPHWKLRLNGGGDQGRAAGRAAHLLASQPILQHALIHMHHALLGGWMLLKPKALIEGRVASPSSSTWRGESGGWRARIEAPSRLPRCARGQTLPRAAWTLCAPPSQLNPKTGTAETRPTSRGCSPGAQARAGAPATLLHQLAGRQMQQCGLAAGLLDPPPGRRPRLTAAAAPVPSCRLPAPVADSNSQSCRPRATWRWRSR